MRLILQRVKSASVCVDREIISAIGKGYLIYLAIEVGDSQKDRDYLIQKILGLRIYPNAEGKLDQTIQQIGGSILVVSQFTLYGDCRKGRRPSFTQSAPIDEAEKEIHAFCEALALQYPHVKRGRFQASMGVRSVNDGPFTLILDS